MGSKEANRKWRETNKNYPEEYRQHSPNIIRACKERFRQNNPLHSTWSAMKQRCYNKNRPRHKDWGGRGICVCDAWLHYRTFEKWCLDNGWQLGLTIDRIDDDGDYSPENCQIITRSENSKKKKAVPLRGIDGRFCSQTKYLTIY